MTEKRKKMHSSSALAGLRETQGETEVLKALRKVYEKLQNLENDRLMSKQLMDTMATQTDDPSTAGEFFCRLTTAEARCQLLEKQLSHIKEILINIKVDALPENSLSSKSSSLLGLNESQQIDLQQASLFTLPPVSLFLKHLREQVTHTTQNEAVKNTRKAESTVNPDSIIPRCQEPQRNGAIPGSKEKSRRYKESSYPAFSKTSRTRRLRSKPPITLFNTSQESETAVSEFGEEPSKEKIRHSEHARKDCRHEAGIRSTLKNSTLHSDGKPSRKKSQSSRQMNKTELSHYHVNVNSMPFVSGMSTTKSHSLRANIQTLYSMVKYCNPALCSAAPHYRQRSSSLDRQPKKRQAGLSKWNSMSDLGSVKRRWRSCSMDNTSKKRVGPHSKDIFEDLDTVPVKLNTSHLNNGGHIHLDNCDQHLCNCNAPGKVCIKTELKNLSDGQQKILEVKMSTPTSPRSAQLLLKEQLPENERRRQLLQDLRNLHYYLQQD